MWCFCLQKYFIPLARLIKRCCKSSNKNCNTYIKLTAAKTAPRWCCQKINLFTKSGQNQLEWKKVFFFAFSHFNNFFGTLGHITAIFNFLDLMLSTLSHSPSPQHSKTCLQSLETKPETHLYYGKDKETFFTPVKKAQNFVIFRDLKLSEGKTMITNQFLF